LGLSIKQLTEAPAKSEEVKTDAPMKQEASEVSAEAPAKVTPVEPSASASASQASDPAVAADDAVGR